MPSPEAQLHARRDAIAMFSRVRIAIRFFFVGLAVVAIHYLTTFILRHDGKPVRLVAQKHVTNLFHQSGVGASAPVRGIKDDNFAAIGKSP